MGVSPRFILVLALILAGVSGFGASQTFPASNHVFVVMLENQGFLEVLPSGPATNCSSAGMPYLCSVAASYGLATQMYANDHGSLLDYLYNTSGSDWTQSPYDCGGGGCSGTAITGDNIVRALGNFSKTWHGYFEDIPSQGYMGSATGNYVDWHNPFKWYSDVIDSSSEQSNMLPFTQFATDLKNGTLANYNYIVPNILDDADGNGSETASQLMAAADGWLQTNIGPLLASSYFQGAGADGVLIVVFDEAEVSGKSGDSSSDNSCSATVSSGCGGRVTLVMAGPSVIPASTTATTYHMQDVLHTTLHLLGVPDYMNNAAGAQDIALLSTAPSAPVITTASLPSGAYNTPYSASLSASGGTPPYAWTVSFGNLPTGLTLNSSTGVISGNPTATGTSNFTVQVSDSKSQTAAKALSITVNLVSIGRVQSNAVAGSGVSSLSASFPSANTAGNLIVAFVRMSTTSQTVTLSDTAGNLYSTAVSQAQSSDGSQIQLFYATNIKGGANTVKATFSSANNHPFLAIYEYSGLSTNSPLDKTAAAQGSSSTPSSGSTAATASADELVFAGLGLPTSSSATVNPGAGYTLEQQDAVANNSRAATEDLLAAASSNYAGNFTLNASANWSAVVATFVASSSPSPLAITTATLPAGTQNVGYSGTLQASGGQPPYAWSIIAGALPTGLNLNSSTGAITGTPSASGTSNFTVQVTDANSNTASKPFSITINTALAVTTTTLPAGTQSVAYNTTLTATGGQTPYTWSITVGALPSGLNLNSSTGAISGTPSGSGTSNFTVQVTDANSNTASKPLSITVNPVSGGGGISLLQATSVQGSGVSSVSAAFPAANTAGNLIIAFVRMSTTSQTVSVTDVSGNVYTDAVNQAQTSDGHQIHIFYAANMKGGANTVKATFSSSNNHPFLAIYEYHGVTTLDQTAAAQGSNSTPGSGPTAATASANELIFSGLGLPSSSSVTVAPGSGYTIEQQDTNVNGSRAASEDAEVATTGSFSGTFTLSSSAEWSCIVATFK
jgi:hypothetical protein